MKIIYAMKKYLSLLILICIVSCNVKKDKEALKKEITSKVSNLKEVEKQILDKLTYEGEYIVSKNYIVFNDAKNEFLGVIFFIVYQNSHNPSKNTFVTFYKKELNVLIKDTGFSFQEELVPINEAVVEQQYPTVFAQYKGGNSVNNKIQKFTLKGNNFMSGQMDKDVFENEVLISPKLIGSKSEEQKQPFFKYVLAEKGLFCRLKPTTNSEILSKIPFGKRVEIRKETSITSFVYDKDKDIDIKGKWVYVSYYENDNIKPIKGYVFDGYLGEHIN